MIVEIKIEIYMLLKPFLRTLSTMWATRPATGSAFPFFEIFTEALEMSLSGFSFFDDDDSTDPLITSQGRECVPQHEEVGMSDERFSEVVRDRVMNGTSEYVHRSGGIGINKTMGGFARHMVEI